MKKDDEDTIPRGECELRCYRWSSNFLMIHLESFVLNDLEPNWVLEGRGWSSGQVEVSSLCNPIFVFGALHGKFEKSFKSSRNHCKQTWACKSVSFSAFAQVNTQKLLSASDCNNSSIFLTAQMAYIIGPRRLLTKFALLHSKEICWIRVFSKKITKML